MTHTHRPVQRVVRALTVPQLAAGVLAGSGPAAASAAACQSWTGAQPPSPGTGNNELDGVAGKSAIADIVARAGFTRFRRAAGTPFNLFFEARP
jgi:hypothetical protein